LIAKFEIKKYSQFLKSLKKIFLKEEINQNINFEKYLGLKKQDT
jgi:hypothetical protein